MPSNSPEFITVSSSLESSSKTEEFLCEIFYSFGRSSPTRRTLTQFNSLSLVLIKKFARAAGALSLSYFSNRPQKSNVISFIDRSDLFESK